MREITISSYASTCFLLDPDGSAEDAEIWQLLNGQAAEIVSIEVGNLKVTDFAGVGRAVRDYEGGLIMIQPNSREHFLRITRTEAPQGDPVRCPFCAGIDVRYANGITAGIKVNDCDPGDQSDLDLDEYQCHGACGGRSFWV